MGIEDIRHSQAESVLKFMKGKGIPIDVFYYVGGGFSNNLDEKKEVYKQALQERTSKILKLYEDFLSHNEIARITGLTRGAVAIIISRAIRSGKIEQRKGRGIKR